MFKNVPDPPAIVVNSPNVCESISVCLIYTNIKNIYNKSRDFSGISPSRYIYI